MLTARIAELDLLNDYLGDDHDLTVMTQLITGEVDSFGSSANVEQLLSLIGQQRQTLQSAAFQMDGSHLCREAEGVCPADTGLLESLVRPFLNCLRF